MPKPFNSTTKLPESIPKRHGVLETSDELSKKKKKKGKK